MFNIASAWKSSFPNAHAGILVMRNASNPAHHAELEEQLCVQFDMEKDSLPRKIVYDWAQEIKS